MGELTEGFVALTDRRTGKRTLRTHVVRTKAAPKMSAKELSALRERMNLSRAFNAQAALLIRMVDRYRALSRGWRRSNDLAASDLVRAR